MPEALLIDPEGTPQTLREMAAQKAQLLVFGNCYCGSTMSAMVQAKKWDEQLPILDVRYVFSGIPPRDEQGQESTGWVDHDGLLWRAFGLGQSLAAVLGADGMLAEGPVGGFEDVAQFVDIKDTLAEAPPIEHPVAAAEQTVTGHVM